MSLLSNNIVEILISIIFIYAVLSILVSILLEWWSYIRRSRGKMLKASIYKLLQDPLNKDYGDLLYNHFMVQGTLNPHKNRPPQYLSPHIFAEALVDVIAQQSRHKLRITLPDQGDEKITVLPGQDMPKNALKRFVAGLDEMNPSPFKDMLYSMYDKCGEDYNQLKPMIEQWYSDYMDRVSGWYKNQLKYKFFFFGLLVAVALNVDSLHLIKVLSLDSGLRNKIVLVAEKTADQYAALSDSARQDAETFRLILIKSTTGMDTGAGDSSTGI